MTTSGNVHLSALQLDELAHGGVREHAHLVSCARCRGDADELAAARAEFLQSGYRRTLPYAITMRAPWRKWRWAWWWARRWLWRSR